MPKSQIISASIEDNVRHWHKAGMLIAAGNVRYWGKPGIAAHLVTGRQGRDMVALSDY
jgi:hypothetical protein